MEVATPTSITEDLLKKEIHDILKNADLAETSAKMVRQQLQKRLDCDLLSKKDVIDKLVMEYVNSKVEDDESEENENEEKDNGSVDEEDETPKPKRSAVDKKPKGKKNKNKSSNEESGSDDGVYDRPSRTKSAAKPRRKAATRKRKGSESESDEDWKQAKKSKKSGGKGKATGFTRPYTLSPELAAVMGAESLPRYEVVKKIWAMIKERNLYDPKNKQFAICDSELHKLLGVKRFRTFAMMKYLRPHFIN